MNRFYLVIIIFISIGNFVHSQSSTKSVSIFSRVEARALTMKLFEANFTEDLFGLEPKWLEAHKIKRLWMSKEDKVSTFLPNFGYIDFKRDKKCRVLEINVINTLDTNYLYKITFEYDDQLKTINVIHYDSEMGKGPKFEYKKVKYWYNDQEHIIKAEHNQYTVDWSKYPIIDEFYNFDQFGNPQNWKLLQGPTSFDFENKFTYLPDTGLISVREFKGISGPWTSNFNYDQERNLTDMIFSTNANCNRKYVFESFGTPDLRKNAKTYDCNGNLIEVNYEYSWNPNNSLFEVRLPLGADTNLVYQTVFDACDGTNVTENSGIPLPKLKSTILNGDIIEILNLPINIKYKFVVYNMNSKNMLSGDLDLNFNSVSGIDQLSPGMYILSISNPASSTMFKFIKL